MTDAGQGQVRANFVFEVVGSFSVHTFFEAPKILFFLFLYLKTNRSLVSFSQVKQ